MALYNILQNVLNESILNEATKKDNGEDDGTSFSFESDEKDPAADADNNETTDEGSDNNEDDNNEGTDFSLEDDDTSDSDETDDSAADDMFKDDPTDDANIDNDDTSTTDDEPVDDDTSSSEEEKIIQPKILNKTKLDLALMKNKLLNQYNGLLTLAYSINDNIDSLKIIISRDELELCKDTIVKIISAIDTYIKYKFYPNNYEINYQNYVIFSKKITDLVAFMDSFGKHMNKDD